MSHHRRLPNYESCLLTRPRLVIVIWLSVMSVVLNEFIKLF